MNSRSIVAALLLVSTRCLSQTSPAPTPPMGWNSWDSYGTTVREEQVTANADAMASDLASHGWQYDPPQSAVVSVFMN
jgi:alpha-galactosidase